MTGTMVVYSDRTTNWPVIAVAVTGGLALVVFGRPWDGPWPGMIGPLAIAFVALVAGLVTSSSMRVTTGPLGVHVRCGVLGLPHFVFARQRITHAEPVAASIWRSWTWGINWTPREGWTFLLRSGPAVRLTLTNGRHVTIGVTDQSAAISALGLS